MTDVDRTFWQRGVSRRAFLKVGITAGAGLSMPWLAACGTQPPGAQAPAAATPAGDGVSDLSGTFKVMSWESEEEMRKWRLHIDDFFKAHYPKINVQLDWGVEWDQYWTKLQATVAGGAQLDMCWMHDSRCQAYASLGLLLPLDDYIAINRPTGWPEEFYQSQVKAFQYEGKQYAIPYDWATGGFYVNLDMLEKAGVEVPTENWTFNDLLQAALKIQQSFEDPSKQWAIDLPTYSVGVHWIVKSFGGDMVAGDPSASHFDQPETADALQFLYDAIWKHKIMPQPGALAGDIDPFAAGRVAISYGLNDGARFIGEAIADKFKWTVAPTPKGKDKRYQFAGGSGFAIPKTAVLDDVAYEVIRDIASNPEKLPVTAQMGSMFVGNSKYWEQAAPPAEMLDPQAFKHTFYELGKQDGIVPNYFPQYQQWDTAVYEKNLSRLWVNETQDVKGVLQQVHTETQALLSS
jgi:multiple sugar transport system substrate-binding protein